MLNKVRGILEVIEYLDPTGQEIVHLPDGSTRNPAARSSGVPRSSRRSLRSWIASRLS
jgi:hypothetical protein